MSGSCEDTGSFQEGEEMNELVGPLPEPPKAPKYPTPWHVIGTTIFAADGKEVLSIAGTAAGLIPIIKDAVNAFVQDKLTTRIEYWRDDYQSLPPDYFKVDAATNTLIGYCDTEVSEEWEDYDEPFHPLGAVPIEYKDLPDFLK